MDTAKIVLLTLAVYWMVSLFVLLILEETNQRVEGVAMILSTGLAYPVVYVLFYPIRAWGAYSSNQAYFQKNGISRFAYIVLHKRVRRNRK